MRYQTLLLTTLVFSAFGQIPAAKPAFRVQGTVVFNDGLPGANLEIVLSSDGYSETIGPILADMHGHFEFEGVPEGIYVLTASSKEYGGYFWGVGPPSEPPFQADGVRVGPGDPLAEVVFRIERRAKVFGVARDQNGDPVSGLGIYALRRRWAHGQPFAFSERVGGTDDEGKFRLSQLPRGSYRFCGAFSDVRAHQAVPVGSAKVNGGLLPVMDIGACTPAQGRFMAILPGEERMIDVRVLPVRGSLVRARVTGFSEDHYPTVELVPRNRAGETQPRFQWPTFRYGAFRFEAVPPGKYWLQASSHDQLLVARRAVEVTLQGPNLLDLALAPHPTVDFKIAAPPGVGVKVGLRDADDPAAPVIYASNPDPSKITLPYPGRYWLIARTEVCLTSARAGDEDLLTHSLTVRSGQSVTIRLLFERQCGAIDGLVEAAGHVVDKARVAVLATGSPRDPGDVIVLSANDEGKFSVIGLTPGIYSLWAWTEDDEIDGNVGSLSEMERQANVLRVGAGEVKKVTLGLTKTFPGARK